MKKSAIALAVAGVLAAPFAASADVTLYGSVRISQTYNDIDNADSFWNVQNESSRWGIKGSEDLGNGLKALFQYEFGVETDTAELGGNGRLSWVGLAGDFGTVAIGRQWSIKYNWAGSYTDIFDATGHNGYGNNSGIYRVGNALAYITPDFSGFHAGIALITAAPGETLDTGEDGLDWIDVGAEYSNGGLSVGGSYAIAYDGGVSGDDMTSLTLAAAYQMEGFRVAGVYDLTDDALASDEEVSAFELTGEYAFDNNRIAVGYNFRDETADNADNGLDAFILAFRHSLSKRTRVFVEYQNVDWDDNGPNDAAQFALGMRHDF